ncbi:MAG TPA: hydantoinase B/oxoprolinase family protein [Burkholderiales bacterium]|nr:hydantoinase B/oxoprolinase family protein [Burkholderiales bacterium]
MKNRFNAVTLEMLWTRLISIVDEAAAALVRTSFSTIVRESNDFACVLTDARGRSLAQATDSIPSFIGTVPRTIRHFLNEFPAETLEPGDILITNDIWQGTGHLPDITCAKPIFLKRKLVGFAGSVAHAPDIGGKMRSADAREVFEEGLQIPVMKVIRRGKIDATFERFVRKNVRVPDQVMGDLWAQFTALHLIENRVLTVLAEHKLSSLADLADEIHRRSEAAMRAAIREVPNGIYRHSAVCDGFEKPIELKMAMTVSDDDIAIDFAGSAAQVPRSINVCLAYTIAYTSYGVKAVLSPNIPNNEGVLRPITITAPEGSILNSTPPAAGGARALMGHFLPMMVITALAKAMPQKVVATIGSPLWCINLSGVKRNANNESKSFTNLFFMNGGFGAAHDRDGANVLSWPSNISSTPVEMIEQLSPLRVKHRRLRTDSGGRGQYRGGTGQEILFENRSESPITVAFLAERTRAETAPSGIAGGEAGAPGAVLINGQRADPKVQHVIEAGGLIELRTPGGGGYGFAAERDLALSDRDIEDGYVSV